MKNSTTRWSRCHLRSGKKHVDDRVEVLIDMGEYNKVLTRLEELESIRAYDDTKRSDEERVPLDEALAEIEQERQ